MIVQTLSEQSVPEYGQGFSRRNLSRMIQFAEVYPDAKIWSALLTKLGGHIFLNSCASMGGLTGDAMVLTGARRSRHSPFRRIWYIVWKYRPMKKRFYALAAGLIALLLALLLWPRQPDCPLELHLELARQRWHTGENLWYKLTVKNVGRKTIPIRDRFWKGQDRVSVNSGNEFGTFLKILDSDGRKVNYDHVSAYGYDGERRFWNNDCGGGKSCQGSDEYWQPIWLKPGQSFTATPSIIAPIRPRGSALDARADPRALPTIPKGWSQEKVLALQTEWKKKVEGVFAMGNPGFRADPNSPPEPMPPGFRITEGYDLEKPGIYSIQAIYAPLGLTGTPGLYSSNTRDMPDDRTWEWKSLGKVFVYRSNVVEFQVVKSSFSYLPDGFEQRTLEQHKDWVRSRRRENSLAKKMEEALSSGWKTDRIDGKQP